MAKKSWVVIVFENEHGDAGVVAYVKGPWQEYADAQRWMDTDKDCADGCCQMAFIEAAE